MKTIEESEYYTDEYRTGRLYKLNSGVVVMSINFEQIHINNFQYELETDEKLCIILALPDYCDEKHDYIIGTIHIYKLTDLHKIKHEIS
jgi:hypothetical protein